MENGRVGPGPHGTSFPSGLRVFGLRCFFLGPFGIAFEMATRDLDLCDAPKSREEGFAEDRSHDHRLENFVAVLAFHQQPDIGLGRARVAVMLRVYLGLFIAVQLPLLESAYSGDFEALFAVAYTGAIALNLLFIEIYVRRKDSHRISTGAA